MRRAGSKLLTLISRAAAPSLIAGRSQIYSRTVGGVVQLFTLDSAGNEKQLSGLSVEDLGDGVKSTLTVDVTDLPPGDLVVFLAGSQSVGFLASSDFRFNADSGGNYNCTYLRTAADGAKIGVATDGVNVSLFPWFLPGVASAPANFASGTTMFVPDYKRTSALFKGCSILGPLNFDNAALLSQFFQECQGIWKNTDAITSVSCTVGGTFTTDTILRAYVLPS